MVVAADKFKHAVTADAACQAIRRGIRQVLPEAEVDLAPMADGGEGTAEALSAGLGIGTSRSCTVTGPLPETQVAATIRISDDGTTAVIDMADAAGLKLLSGQEANPLKTTTFGVGELIRHAADAGCRRILVGLGGSATCDAGLGAAQALGMTFRIEGEGDISRPFTGADLLRLEHVEVPTVGLGARVVCLADVDSFLTGQAGAAQRFARQKGADDDGVAVLERGLERAVEVCGRSGNEKHLGAAGGLAYGLGMACKADVQAGVDAVTETVGLRRKLQEAYLCFTGEGRFDASSLDGKVAAGVGKLCREAEVPCVVLAGSVDSDTAEDASSKGISGVFSLTREPQSLDEAIAATEDRLEQVAAQVVRFMSDVRRRAGLDA
jgi:glycerate kinase